MRGQGGAIWRNVRDLLIVAAGCVLFALSYVLFLTPNQVANGGVGGIAMVIKHFSGFPMGTMTVLLNIPIFAFTLYRLGWKVLASTLFAVVLSNALIDVGLLFLPSFTDDLLLASLYGGALQGVGMGLMFSGGASAGGTSLISRIVRSYKPQLKIGKLVLLIDAVVITASALAFRNINLALYAAISLVAATQVMDLILYGTDFYLAVHIISEKPKELGEAIRVRMTRNVTYLTGMGGYTGAEKQVIYCVMHRSESAVLAKLVKDIDPAAFVSVIQAKEIYGGSFGMQ